MKQLASTYSISGAAVTLTGVNVPLSQILLISDATTGSVLYSMAGPAASSYTQAANSVITLASAPGASDKLTIYFDDGVAPANAPSSVSVSNFPATLQLGSGVVTATTQRVTLATDGPEVTNSTAIKNSTAYLDVALSTRLKPSDTLAAVTTVGTITNPVTVADQTSGNATTKIVNGANTLAVDSAGAVNANLGPSTSYPYSAVIPSTSTTIIGPVNCSSFRVAAVHVVAVGTGVALTPQISNDGTNWLSAQTQRTDSPGQFGQSAGIFTTLGAGQFHQVYLYGALYFRIIGNSTSGTTTLSVNMSQAVLQVPNQAITAVNSLLVSPQTNTSTTASGFATFHSLSCAATTNATSVKTTSSQIGFLSLTNNSATWAYFHLVNKSSAPTVGTDAGVLNIGVAPNSTLDCGTSFCGIRMSLGLSYYVSNGPSSLDTGALAAANTFIVNMSYA